MDWQMVGLGCLGGLVPDIVRIVQNRYKTELPEYLKSANFLIGLVLLVLLGGLAAWLGDATQPKEALAYGFAAPELVSRLLSTKEITAAKPEPLSQLRRFWAL